MPIKRSAYKEIRKAKKRHARNIPLKSELKTIAKKFDKLISDKKINEAKASLNSLISKFDKAASKGILHKNAASRSISRFMKKLAALSKA